MEPSSSNSVPSSLPLSSLKDSLNLCFSEGELVLHFGQSDAEYKFLKNVHKVQLEGVRRLEMRYMDEVNDKDVKRINAMMQRMQTLHSVFLGGGHWTPIRGFCDGLKEMLGRVERQLYFLQFRFDPESLKTVLESARNVKEIVFIYCEIANLPKNFEIDADVEFHVETIYFYKTIQESDMRLMNDDTFDILVKAMSECKLKTSLKHIYLDEQGYEEQEKQDVFTKLGFNLIFHLDEDFPDPLKLDG